ncbi:uncharacterized protein DS421_10g295710 [Arachis hypogaea]|nr:uncharacterized protein DS421_10g295710 [Arachis hypogaea]
MREQPPLPPYPPNSFTSVTHTNPHILRQREKKGKREKRAERRRRKGGGRPPPTRLAIATATELPDRAKKEKRPLLSSSLLSSIAAAVVLQLVATIADRRCHRARSRRRRRSRERETRCAGVAVVGCVAVEKLSPPDPPLSELLSESCRRRTPLPPLRSAAGESPLPEFWSSPPFEVAAGAAAKPVQRPPLFHFLSSDRVLSVACHS